ncbi:hypothetical protein [Paenibacillus sp. GCM10023250]|uniref:hypothetical protein n=1 Tax=Paenibacillus sp. GCM10023250 TaxID=3252648 RepID=UPI003621178E
MMNIEREKNLGTGSAGGRLWTARILNGIVILFMLFDGIGKVAGQAFSVEGTLALGFTETHMAAMGVLACYRPCYAPFHGHRSSAGCC